MTPLYRIVFHAWKDLDFQRAAQAACFGIFVGDDDTERFYSFEFLYPTDRLRTAKDNGALKDAVLRWAVSFMEQTLALLPSSDVSNRHHEVEIKQDEEAEIQHLLHRKVCDYRLEKDRHFFCVANRGSAAPLPVALPTCGACSLPSADVLCSHLTHPDSGIQYNLGGAALSLQAWCNQGHRKEVGSPKECRAGGHPCWERLVAPEPERMRQAFAPHALPEALDFLDATWRLAFNKERLLSLKSAVTVAALVEPCANRKEFTAGVSALDDTLKLMTIGDNLIPEAERELPAIKGDKTLNRMKSCLKSRLSDAVQFQRATNAIEVLRLVSAVRVALQHSGRSSDLGRALAGLGIAHRPNWGDTWDQIRSRTVDALSELRAVVTTLE